MTWVLYICLHGYINGLPDSHCRTEQRHVMGGSFQNCAQALREAKLPPNALAVCRLEPEKK